MVFGAAIPLSVSKFTENKPSFNPQSADSYPETWRVKWVYIIHLSKNRHTVWTTHDDTVAHIVFGKGAKHVAKKRRMLVLTTENDTPFTHTRNAFSLALRAYPFAEFFAKFNDEVYFESKNIFPQISAQILYWGIPIIGNNCTYADGNAGYVLSREAAQILHKCHVDQYNEDLAVGWCLHQAGVSLVSPHRLLRLQMIIWDKPVQGIMTLLSFNWGP
jgi:hypothetical protein